MEKNSRAAYYYGPPGAAFVNGGYAAPTPQLSGMETIPYMYGGPGAYPIDSKESDLEKPKGRCFAPCFALLFVIFLLTSIGLVVAWGVLSDGFKHVDTRKAESLSDPLDSFEFQPGSSQAAGYNGPNDSNNNNNLNNDGQNHKNNVNLNQQQSQYAEQNMAVSGFQELANGFSNQNFNNKQLSASQKQVPGAPQQNFDNLQNTGFQPQQPHPAQVHVHGYQEVVPTFHGYPEGYQLLHAPVYPEAPPAEIPPAPGYPEMPPASGYPEIPPAPGYPEMPSAPGYPKIPPAPGYPEMPSAPGYPEIPPAPGYPKMPSAPEYPEIPAAPEYHELPPSPVYPADIPLVYPAPPGYPEQVPIYPQAPVFPELPEYPPVVPESIPPPSVNPEKPPLYTSERMSTMFPSTPSTTSSTTTSTTTTTTTTTTTVATTAEPRRRPTVCGSQPCAMAAAEMLKNMKSEVSPCEDFYEFACGNYKEHHNLPEDKRRINTLGDLNTQLKRQLKVLIEAPISSSDLRSTKMAKTFYKSCMDIKAIDETDLAPLMELMKEFGQWPILDNTWSERGYVWEEQTGILRVKAAVEGIIAVIVYVDMEQSNKRMLTIDQPGLGLGSREYYMKGKKSELVQAYLKYMIDMAVMFGADPTEAAKQMEEVLDFEMMIANISTPEEDRRDHNAMHNPMTISELKTQVPMVDWDSFLTPILEVEGVSFGSRDKINILALPYLQQLGNVLQLTRKQAIANYLIGNLIASYIDYLPTKYRKPYQDFREVFSGVSSDQARWEECVGSAKSFMQWPIGAMYVQKYFTPEAKTEMETLVGNLHEIMRQNLHEASWMDAGTKLTAQTKLEKMGSKIGYPEYTYNETKINEDYHGINLTETSYFNNVMSITRNKIQRRFRELMEPVDKSEWSTSPAVVNAFYSWSRNEIVFPAGILQFPIFTLGAPRYVNYPRIGMVIGHEITHGYDDQGRQYGPDGNLKEWWNQQTLDSFTRKANCFIKQYGDIVEPVADIKLNGRLTVGENIADNGGLRIAHDAYNLWTVSNPDTVEPDLPGMQNYTSEQLFFISFANGWCEMVRPKAVEFYVTMDVHSLGRYRVNVPLKNFPAFSRAFQCAAGTPMNPEKKCRVW